MAVHLLLLECDKSTCVAIAAQLIDPAFSQFFEEPQQRQPLLFWKDAGDLFHRGGMLPRDFGDVLQVAGVEGW